jgi:hypothetical protein
MQRDATQLGIAVDLMNRIEARYNVVRDLLRVRRTPNCVPFFAIRLLPKQHLFLGARVFLWCTTKGAQ